MQIVNANQKHDKRARLRLVNNRTRDSNSRFNNANGKRLLNVNAKPTRRGSERLTLIVNGRQMRNVKSNRPNSGRHLPNANVKPMRRGSEKPVLIGNVKLLPIVNEKQMLSDSEKPLRIANALSLIHI